VLALIALVLGYIGFSRHAIVGTKPALDRLYLALQLFVLNWSPEGGIPFTLDVARFLAPAVSVLGAVEMPPVPGMAARYGSDFVAALPTGGVARCNPVNARTNCSDAWLEPGR
jgi:hypothetical protein